MMKRRDVVLGGGLAAAVSLGGPPARAQVKDPENTIFLDTKDGRITIRLRNDLAPRHAAQLKTLVRRGFYNGVVFQAEFSAAPFRRGTVGMARSQEPHSANSQFFICFTESSFLNGQYTVVGEVESGMEVVDKIKKGSKADNGSVTAPDKIIKMQIAADAK